MFQSLSPEESTVSAEGRRKQMHTFWHKVPEKNSEDMEDLLPDGINLSFSESVKIKNRSEDELIHIMHTKM